MQFREKPNTGNLSADVLAFLVAHDCAATATHCKAVADQAVELALRFGVRVEAARSAGWLHDVSAVIPVGQRLAMAHRWGLSVLPEEAALPMILHQKLSAWMAQHLFHVTAPDILDAIRCHTTLRAHATALDQVVFVADKIAWDQAGVPPYLPALRGALAHSLSAAASVYVAYLWERRATLQVIHPWLRQAYRDLIGSADAPRISSD